MKLLKEKPTTKDEDSSEEKPKKIKKGAKKDTKDTAEVANGKKTAGKRLAPTSRPKHTVVPKHWTRRRPTPKDVGLFVIPIVAVAIVVGLLFYFQDTRNSYTLESEAAQYYRGTRYVIDASTVLHREEEDGITMMPVGDNEYSLSNLPIYYDGEDIVLPTDMLHYDPRGNQFSYVPYFTQVYQDGSRTVASRDGEEVQLNGGFLYDGKDTYIFLEEVTLYFNGYAIYLPAFSYIEAVYTYEVTAFNYAAMETIFEVPNGSVTVKSIEDEYEVSLLSDMVNVTNGTTALLHSQPNLLESIF